MKTITKISSIVVFFIMAVSCASTYGPVPEKYNFDNQLESIDKISTFKVSKISSWDQIDKQSIMLKVNFNDYYLLILRRPITSTYSNLTIGVERSMSGITPGFDRIVMQDHYGPDYYHIVKIYRLKDREQVIEIKERLAKK